MPGINPSQPFQLRLLETVADMIRVENLQRLVWPGNETDIVPAHLLLAAVHNGGLVIGAFEGANDEITHFSPDHDVPSTEGTQTSDLVGFVFGFPGIYETPDGPRLKHHSHMAAVHPDFRDRGVGFSLKRAQWQLARHQGLDLITWTYDPLLSRNANLNISRLGAVCSTYLREAYGEMRDGLNKGLPSDRFKVDWWINSQRVVHRLSRKARRKLDLAHFLAAEVDILNPSSAGLDGLSRPAAEVESGFPGNGREAMYLLEIPANFSAIKTADPVLALDWRIHIRRYCEELFQAGYLVTDFVYLPGTSARSFYVFSNGMSTL